MNSETTTPRYWDGDPVGDRWHCGARRATVLIESAEHEALAVLMDDRGQPSYYQIKNEQVPAFIAAATAAWSRPGDAHSVAVIWGSRLSPVIKGGVVPSPPPPIVDAVLRPSIVTAHHQLLAVLELTLHR